MGSREGSIMAKLLIVTSTGSQESTRASVPFHIAANGAAPVVQKWAVALAGDATDLLKQEVALGVRGVGIPPLVDLLASCSRRVSASMFERAAPRPGGVLQQHLEGRPAEFITPPDLVRLTMEADRILSF
jgi:predicted peroxiredoxin